MTNVQAAAAEGLTLSKITALANTTLEFSIPVYKNMPAGACVKPTLDGSPNNKLSALGVDGFALTPTFNRDTESYDLIVDPSVASVTVAASAIDSKATIAGTGTVDLQSGVNEITVTVKAANGNLRNYVLHVVRQSGGPTYSSSIGSGVSSEAALAVRRRDRACLQEAVQEILPPAVRMCRLSVRPLREAVQEALLPGSLHRDRM